MSPSTPPNVVCEGGVCRIVEPEPKTVTKSQEQMPEPTSALAKLLGESLLSKDGLVPLSTISGKGKVIALYFSAHWCGPCRSFTPQLAEIYNDFKASHARAADWEIVFVSSDRQQESFDEYYADMPWLALPFEQRDRKATLSSKFKVKGIPSLVLIDGEDGSLITSSGRDAVTSDPQGEQFPWKPKTLSELLSGKLVDKEGKEHDGTAALANKYKLIYFSALWCPPCKAFTPQLSQVVNKLKAEGKALECIFISADRSDEDFKSYLSEMGSFLAVPFADQPTKAALNTLFDLDGIPTLVVVDPEDNLVTTNGREAVGTDPEGVDFPWRPKPVDRLGPYTASSLNDGPVLLLALDDTTPEEGAARSEELLGDVARATLAAGEDVTFLYTPKSNQLMEQVIDFCKMEPMRAGKETVVLLDVPSQCFYKMGAEMAPGAEGGYYPSGAITGSAIQELVSQYLAGSLPKIPLA